MVYKANRTLSYNPTLTRSIRRTIREKQLETNGKSQQNSIAATRHSKYAHFEYSFRQIIADRSLIEYKL